MWPVPVSLGYICTCKYARPKLLGLGPVTHSLRCLILRGVREDPIMVRWFGHLLFPRSRKMIKFKQWNLNRTKLPISSNFEGIGFGFLGLELNNNLVGHENPNCPGGMNTSLEHQTIIIYGTYAQRTGAARKQARMAEGLHQRKLLSCKRHGPCDEVMPTRGRREDRQSRAADGSRRADATSMTPSCALPTTCNAACRRECPLCFFFPAADASGQRKK